MNLRDIAMWGMPDFGGNKNKNPADEAQRYLSQIPGQTGQYYQPYIDAGRQALDQYQGQIGQLTGNTGDVYNRLAGGYQESPGYQRALQQALQAGTHASAAGGMLGTPQSQQQSMQMAGDVANRDFQDYLKNQMGLYGMGMEGLGNLNQMGYGASTGYGDILGNVLGQQAQYGYAGQAGENQRKSQQFGDMASMATAALPFLFL